LVEVPFSSEEKKPRVTPDNAGRASQIVHPPKASFALEPEVRRRQLRRAHCPVSRRTSRNKSSLVKGLVCSLVKGLVTALSASHAGATMRVSSAPESTRTRVAA